MVHGVNAQKIDMGHGIKIIKHHILENYNPILINEIYATFIYDFLCKLSLFLKADH